MEQYAFFHDSHEVFYRNPFGAVPCCSRITIRFAVNSTILEVHSVICRLWKNGHMEEKVEMHRIRGCNIYECEITSPSTPSLLWYFFIIQCKDKTYYYGNNAENAGGIGVLSDTEPNSYQITVYSRDFKTPSWFKDSIMYQIFVDRFYNGNDDGSIKNIKKDSIIHKDWNETPNYKPDPETGEFMCNDFFGGNLKGIIKKLPYLKELGVNVLYLNPIFESSSNHKYNTGNYMKIDPMYGDEVVFRELVKSAHDMGISIILDGVFNHTGSDSIYFNKDGHYPDIGAYMSPDSTYYKWYSFKKYPDDYDCWWGIKTLPSVNELEPSYQDFVYKGKNSIIKHWGAYGINGWRLDVADELPDEFIKGLRKAVKEIDNDAVIIGEVWEDASNKVSYDRMKEYLLGDELDSVMNYPLKDGLLMFLTGKLSGEQLGSIIMRLYENYPCQCFYSLMNILGTHDTCRVKSILGGIECTEGSYSRENEAKLTLNSRQEKLALKRLYMALLFLMTFPGVPCIYYGDEAGLEGCHDPFNRKTYPWGGENAELINFCKKLAGIRNGMDALRTGEFIPIHADENTYGFIRYIKNNTDIFGQQRENGFALLLLNRDMEKTYDLNINLKKWNIIKLSDALCTREALASKDSIFNISIHPLEAVLFQGSMG